MTRNTRSKPWHEVVRLKEELRSGELALAEFAADLHEVTLAEGRRCTSGTVVRIRGHPEGYTN